MSLAGVDLTKRYLRTLFREVYRLNDSGLWSIKFYARYLRWKKRKEEKNKRRVYQ